MERELFFKCPLCNGTKKTITELNLKYKPGYGLPIGSKCLCNDGYIPSGLTESQVSKAVGERDALIVLIHDTLKTGDEVGYISAIRTLRDIWRAYDFNMVAAVHSPARQALEKSKPKPNGG